MLKTALFMAGKAKKCIAETPKAWPECPEEAEVLIH